MVGGYANDGIIGNSRFFQLADKLRKCLFKLQLIAEIVIGLWLVPAPVNRRNSVQIICYLNIFLILNGMSADSHIIKAEGLLVYIFVNGGIYHHRVLSVTLDDVFHTVSEGKEIVIAQIFVGLVTIIEIVSAVMVSAACISQTLQLISHSEIIIVISDIEHGINAVCGNKPRHKGILPR